MNFSNNGKLSKILSMILVLCLMTTLFAGCKKTETPEDTSENFTPNLNLSDNTTPSSSAQTVPTESQVQINENTATVTGNLNIRSSPSTDAVVTGTLYAGDKVEIDRRETIAGYEWAYIISPTSGWIVMDFVEMDIKSNEPAGTNTSTPAGNGDVTVPATTEPTTSSTNLKGVITVNALNIRSEASTETGKVQGSYDKGDVVTILETKNGWGRTNKGWIKMEYVNTSGTTGGSTTNTTTNTNTDSSNTTNNTTTTTITSNGSTTVVWKGVVRVQELNVRSNASSTATRLGSVTYGQRVEVLEKSGNWGRISKGWICLDYVYEDGTTGTKTATGTVTGNGLNIRSGPGKTYASVGSYNSGDQVSILEQFTYNGTTWGCTKKGWISMDYVDTGDNSTSNDTDDDEDTSGHTGTITANHLNIRSGPGKDYASVGSLEYGDRVTIEYEKIVDDASWGKIAKGWISMDYVDLD